MMSFVQEIAFEFRAEMSNCMSWLINPEKYIYSVSSKNNIYFALRESYFVKKRFRFDKEINDRNDPQTYVDIPVNCFHFSDFKQNLNILKNYWRLPLYVNLFRISERWTDGRADGQTDKQTARHTDRETYMLSKANVCTFAIFNTNTKNGSLIIVLGLILLKYEWIKQTRI
jgi:hypothetical protein